MKLHARGLSHLLVCSLLFALLLVPMAAAQSQSGTSSRALTKEDYQRAEKMAFYNTASLIDHNIQVAWLPDDRLWYQNSGLDGSQFIIFNPTTGRRQPAFDHANLAAGLSAAAAKKYDAKHLPFSSLQFSADGKSISVDIEADTFRCDLSAYSCSKQEKPAVHNDGLESISPDGKKAVFIRDYNLWVRDVATNKETPLTTEGIKDFSYAIDSEGWRKSKRPVVMWSPDSKKIATYQQDERGVGDWYLVETRVGHPVLQQWKYPLPGDDKIAMISRVIIELDGAKVIRLQMPPDAHRSTLCDGIRCRDKDAFVAWSDVMWSPDAKQLAFVSTSRDHKHETFRVADAATGVVRDVFEESAATYFESGLWSVNFSYMPKSNEVLWFSERSGWGHLYLYDLATGKQKVQITSGDWTVIEVLRIDPQNRQIYFLANGRESQRNPYHSHLYRVGFDGNGLTLLTPENAHHSIKFSPSRKFFADEYSSTDVPPIASVRDASGKSVATLEKTDVSRLLAIGWKPPIEFSFKGRDGVTDVYGLLYLPPNSDSTGKHPIIDYIYPGPSGGSVGSFGYGVYDDRQALAQLGFAVVAIEGMGNPSRSKKFHDTYYGNMGDNTLPDQILGIKYLASKYPWIDIDRVGIYGVSGGGFATADAMFRYPDFFKVGVSMSGNHDNRLYEDDWGERYQGLLTKNPDGTTSYDNQANQLIAKNLKGHLLITHGTLDSNVPPDNTLLVVDALIRANKDFDLIMFPNQHHGYGDMQDYMTRRLWDYFVRYLLGVEPPHEYEMNKR